MSLSDKVKRQLYFESGGYCMNPTCNRELYPYFSDNKRVNISDLAHIIGQSVNGPRGESDYTLKERDNADNILLLCKLCHKGIDDNPEEFPVSMLLEWKNNHIKAIRSCFIEPVYSNRSEARIIIARLIAQNKHIFNTYGPFSEHALNPMTNINKIWDRKCVDTLIPNNKKIIRLLDKNIGLLTEHEVSIFERFREHTIEFEYNKVSGIKNPFAPTYPDGFDDILKEV